MCVRTAIVTFFVPLVPSRETIIGGSSGSFRDSTELPFGKISRVQNDRARVPEIVSGAARRGSFVCSTLKGESRHTIRNLAAILSVSFSFLNPLSSSLPLRSILHLFRRLFLFFYLSLSLSFSLHSFLMQRPLEPCAPFPLPLFVSLYLPPLHFPRIGSLNYGTS